MTTSVHNQKNELKDYLVQLDSYLKDRYIEFAGKCYKAILEKVDDEIAKCREKGLKIAQKREVWYQTCLGTIKIQRREYRGEDGGRRCLLDQLTGMGKYEHTTATVKELALEIVSQMPYRRSAEVLRRTTAIDLPHQTIWRLVAKSADSYLAQEEQELQHFIHTGEIPQGEDKKVSRLIVEADGVILSLQREQERRMEVKLGIAYEGWEKIGKDRYKTVNKTIFGTVTHKDLFWEGMSLKLQKHYDLSRLKESILGGDGASWIKEGSGYLKGHYQLDRYHLNKELCAAFGRDNQIKGRIWAACEKGDINQGLQIMSEAIYHARGEAAVKMARAYRYLKENSSGVVDYRLALGESGQSLRRTGAMEGNNDKLIVRRMKNQGMSWTVKGIARLLCIRFLVLEKQLYDWLHKPLEPIPNQTKLSVTKVRRIVNKLSSQEPDQWIQAGVPALYGPHASRPWVKMLKSITMVSV